MIAFGTNAKDSLPSLRTRESVSSRITPPGTACRILPVFSPPGCHFYDSYLNCFQHRPEVRGNLRDAARRYAAHRLAVLHAENPHHTLTHHYLGTPHWAEEGEGSLLTDCDAALSGAALERRVPVPCRCGLNAAQLFATVQDVPQPALPLSKCELHEVLLALPPRWQNYPWRLCFDTARDGFSLSTLYRSMEAVEKQQAQGVRTVAFGLFFVHSRDDAPTRPATVTSPSAVAAARTSVGAGGEKAAAHPASSTSSSAYISPVNFDAPSSFLAVKRSSSLRYGAARDALSYGVIGCFTPEVPCLAHRAANIYFGSAETTVFSLNPLELSRQRGEWMLRAFEAAAEQHRQQQQRQGQQEMPKTRANQQEGNIAGVALRAPFQDESDRPPPEYNPPRFPRAGALTSTHGFAQMSDLADQVHVPVPQHTHITIEHLGEVHREGDGSGDVRRDHCTSVSPSSTAANSFPFTSSLSSSQPRSCSQLCQGTGSVGKSHASLHGSCALTRRSLGGSPVKGVVPRAPLLVKYGWSNRLDNRKFIVCNRHFLALGAGKSGAALYVDEALQFGTSSHWCETFNSPCLFGAQATTSTTTSAASSALTSPANACAAAAGKEAHTVDMTPPFPASAPSSLPHREFALSRVVWFAITEDRRTFRLMSDAGAGAMLTAAAEAASCSSAGCGGQGDDSTRCCCGRTGITVEAGLADGGECGVGKPVGLSFLHHCDLLPFTEQPY
ncbi:hypothetical protein NQL31_003547 [Lotmaria passim]